MIRLRYPNDDTQIADLVRDDDRNLEDNDEFALETATLISLFTDRRDEDQADSVLPADTYLGGWWGDSYSDEPWGSKLWTLKTHVLSNTTLEKAKTFAYDALKWMIEDKVASSIEVFAERGQRRGLLLLTVSIFRPNAKSPFERLWEVNLDGI